MRRNNNMEGLIEDDWKDHWSRNDADVKASKTVIELPAADDDQEGINVNVEEESLKEYLDDEVSGNLILARKLIFRFAVQIYRRYN